jgi:TolA-binding protein
MLLATVVMGVVFAAATGISFVQVSPRELGKRFDRAQQMMIIGDFEGSIAAYRQLTRTPASPLLRPARVKVTVGEEHLPLTVAAAYQVAGSWRRRGSERLEAAEDASERAAGYEDLGRAARAYKELAADAFTPDNVRERALFQVGKCRFSAESFAEAIAAFDTFRVEFSASRYGIETRYLSAWALFRMSAFEQSAATFLQASMDTADTDRARRSLFQAGECFAKLANNQEALTAFKTLTDQFDPAPYEGRRRTQQVMRVLRENLTSTERELIAKAHIRVGDVYRNMDSLSVALEWYRLAAARFPTEDDVLRMAYLRQAEAWVAHDSTERALAAYRDALEQIQDAVFRARTQAEYMGLAYAEGRYLLAADAFRAYAEVFAEQAGAVGFSVAEARLLEAESLRMAAEKHSPARTPGGADATRISASDRQRTVVPARVEPSADSQPALASAGMRTTTASLRDSLYRAAAAKYEALLLPSQRDTEQSTLSYAPADSLLADALLGAGLCYLAMDSLETAAARFALSGRCYRWTAAGSWAVLELARLLVDQGDPAAAICALEDLLYPSAAATDSRRVQTGTQAPGSPMVNTEAVGELEHAPPQAALLDSVAAALTAHPDAVDPARVELARLYERRGQQQQALRLLLLIRPGSREFVAARMDAARLHSAAGQPHEAEACLTAAWETGVSPEQEAELGYALALLALEQGRTGDATERLGKVNAALLAPGTQAEFLYMRGATHFQRQAWTAAYQDLLLCRRQAVDAALRRQTVDLLGHCMARLYRAPEGQERFIRWIAASASVVEREELMLAQARFLHRAGADSACVAALRAATFRGPELGRSAEMLESEALLALEAWDAGLELLEAMDAATMRPEEAARRMYLAGIAAMNAGHHILAAERLTTLLELDPHSDMALEGQWQLGRCLSALGQHQRAADVLLHLAAECPGAAHADDAAFLAGESLYLAGAYARAAAAYRQVYLAPRLPEAGLALAWCQLELGKPAEMISQLRAVRNAHPRTPQASAAAMLLGDYYYNEKDYHSARQAYEDLLQHYPDSEQAAVAADLLIDLQDLEADLVYQAAMATFGLGQYADSARLLQAVIDRYPDTLSEMAARCNLGATYEQLGLWHDALASYERTLQAARGRPECADMARFAEEHRDWISEYRL